jgi:outer membrane lipoprotein-sorting protein
MSKAELNANYTPSFVAEERLSDGTNTWHVLLTPKTRMSYKSAELWVDVDGMPRQAKIVEQNDDSTTVLLSKPRINDKLNAEIFKLNYPGSAKKIKA